MRRIIFSIILTVGLLGSVQAAWADNIGAAGDISTRRAGSAGTWPRRR
jgi:hypothetical protein